jgi:hypothetical protein
MKAIVAGASPLLTLLVEAIKRAKRLQSAATLLCVAAALSFSTIACAGSARDYLNAPIDSWLTTYNASYSASVTPEDGTDVSSRVRSNVFAQSVVISRTMDFWCRTGGLSVVLPYVFAEVDSSSLQARTTGVSDIGFLWQMNIFGGPALTREQYCALGAVQTSFSTMSSWSPSLLASQMRKRYASPSGSCGESWRSPQLAARLNAPIARQVRGRQRAENIRTRATQKGEDNGTEHSEPSDGS